MRSRTTEPTTSPQFQRLTGYLVALELTEGMPGMYFEACVITCRESLSRLGEPEPTMHEIEGIRDFYDEVPYITTIRRN